MEAEHIAELMEVGEIVGEPPRRFRRFLRAEVIDRRVLEIAQKMRSEYAGKLPIMVGVLNGSFIFLADLIRYMAIPCEVDFVKISSYEKAMRSSGAVLMKKDLDAQVADRHVVLVEDIVDTGGSVRFLLDHFRQKKPASLAVATLFLKPEVFQPKCHLDYVGLEIPNRFVVGYGLDCGQQWRHLCDLYALMDESS
ncbi:MAG: hypoxanthine phosphoribosyltransferase [bacterium]